MTILNVDRGPGTELQCRGIAHHTHAYRIVVSLMMLVASVLIASQSHLAQYWPLPLGIKKTHLLS